MSSTFTQVEGRGGLGVLVVAEASGEAENAAGLPLRRHAPSGAVFEMVIRRNGWTRDQFWITNILRCRPPNNWLEGAPWERAAIDHCQSNLQEVIDKLRPRAIVALGGTAAREITGLSGEKLGIRYIRGYTVPSRYGIPTVPTFHPSFLARGQMKFANLMMRDIGRAIQVAQSGDYKYLRLEDLFKYEISIEALRELYSQALADPMLLITYDLETETSAGEEEDDVFEYSRDEGEDDVEEPVEEIEAPIAVAKIKTIQFAVSSTWGVSVPWRGEFKRLAIAILGLPNPKLGHNVTWFDNRVLEGDQVRVAGPIDDSLVAFKALWPESIANLQAVTGLYWPEFPLWKHMSNSNLEQYGVADVITPQRFWPLLKKDMERLRESGLSVWDGYTILTRSFLPLLRAMEQRGLPIDAERLTELRTWLSQELVTIDATIQQTVSDNLKVWTKITNLPTPIKDQILAWWPELLTPVEVVDKRGKAKLKVPKWTSKLLYEKLRSQDDMWPALRARACVKFGLVERSVDGQLWLGRQKDFNVGSSKQLLTYLKSKGYQVPVRFKDGKETTGAKEIERLAASTKDPVLGAVIERRSTAKLIDSYTGKADKDGILRGGWIPASNGRLRATYGFTATWQLWARNPNVLTLPKRRGDLAKKFRSCIAAEPGHTMVELDYTAFHAKTTGLEARDARYMSLAAMDIHSYVAGHMVGFMGIEGFWDLSETDQRAMLAEIKRAHKAVRDFKAKPSILGIGFGMGYKRLYFENRDSFSSEVEAKRLLELIKSLFPELFVWQDRVCEEAHSTGRLISKWGAVRWFWDVFGWKLRDGQWIRSGGKDAEKAKAFLPANDAHGTLRWKLLQMDLGGGIEDMIEADKALATHSKDLAKGLSRGPSWLERYELVNVVHDAVVFHCPTPLVEECVAQVGAWLQAPVLLLADSEVAPEGFACGVEASTGPDLGNMEVWKNG